MDQCPQGGAQGLPRPGTTITPPSPSLHHRPSITPPLPHHLSLTTPPSPPGSQATCDLPEPPQLSTEQISLEEVVTELSKEEPATHRIISAIDAKFASGAWMRLHKEHSMATVRKVYTFFDSQRTFIRSMTDTAEEMRGLSPDSRQVALQGYLNKLTIPPLTYFPLSYSDEACCQLLRFTPDESIVFNTKARCPLMLICEVKREDYSVKTITRSKAFRDNTPLQVAVDPKAVSSTLVS